MLSAVRRSLLTVALVGLVAGCSGGGGGDAPRDADPGAAAPADDAGAGAGVEEFDPEKALVEQTVALPASPEDKVAIGVLSLQVKGEVMFLRLAITPDFASASDNQAVPLFTSLGKNIFNPSLVDVENLKEYSVVQAARGGRRWSSNDLTTKSRNGTPMLAYAVFAAPEDDITSIDVRVTDFWPAFTDVPITR